MLTAKIKELTHKSNVILTSRCNDAIKLALLDAKSKGKNKAIMFTVGQWVTYDQFAEELGFEIVKVENPDCMINIDILNKHLDSQSVLIIHSLSAYYYPQPMQKIYELCQSKDSLLINDCCGSIGFTDLLLGDYLVCSFGRWKPINFGKGGFLATNFNIKSTNVELSEEDILNKINNLPSRIEKLNDKSLAIIADILIAGLKPLNKSEKYNLVVIVPFESQEEKETILAICDNQQVEYKECPFDIRSNRKAISIEVKRI